MERYKYCEKGCVVMNSIKTIMILHFLIVISTILKVSTGDEITVQMPLVQTEEKGAYICYAHPLDTFDEKYIESSMIDVNTQSKLVHHVSIGVCGQPASSTNLWQCSKTHLKGKNCDGAAINFVGWDDLIGTHDKFIPPKGLSIKVGRKTQYRYLLIEVHFSEMVKDPTIGAANVTLKFTDTPGNLLYQSYLLLNSGYIPGNRSEGFFTDIACPWNKPSVMAHRYYLHTHHNGILVEGYIVRNGTWILIGSQLSKDQPRETYNIPGGPIEIKTGDILTTRCLYINPKEERIDFGLRSEMCNFNIEFGYRQEDEIFFTMPLGCMTDSPTFSFCDHTRTSGIC